MPPSRGPFGAGACAKYSTCSTSFVERVDADDADGLGHRVEAVERAGERAGVRERGLAALLGAADLDRHHGLAGVARVFAGAPEFGRIADQLDEAGDHLHLRVVGEIADVVGRVEPDLVAGGERVARAHAARAERALDRHHDAAALAEHGDRPGFEVGDAVIGDGDELVGRGEIAEAVRPRHREAGLLDGAPELHAELAALGIAAFAEAAGEHGGAARIGLAGVDDGVDRRRARHDHHHMVGLLRQLVERRDSRSRRSRPSCCAD